jgi:hypothetical protein
MKVDQVEIATAGGKLALRGLEGEAGEIAAFVAATSDSCGFVTTSLSETVRLRTFCQPTPVSGKTGKGK